MRYEITQDTLQDIINIESGLFSPLRGFMNSQDYHSVVNEMVLSDGTVWTIPITLDINECFLSTAMQINQLILTLDNNDVAIIVIDDIFKINKADIIKIYQTDDVNHPGVEKELKRSIFRVGGEIKLINKIYLDNCLSPLKTKEYFKSQGWKSIVGFQTRNPIHRAHEYLQRVGLEICDALFINPLVGWKKKGDFSEQAIIDSYNVMIKEYYTGLNVYFDILKTQMRYAGPREAIFHAIIRKNLGCTHFIIGRDHAGVGEYYGKYDAHILAKELMLKYDLGIELLLLSEPFYCTKCSQMVSESTCGHNHNLRKEISGAKIRAMLNSKITPPVEIMRPEIFEAILKSKQIFIREEEK